jgi:hypothetical protein
MLFDAVSSFLYRRHKIPESSVLTYPQQLIEDCMNNGIFLAKSGPKSDTVQLLTWRSALSIVDFSAAVSHASGCNLSA